LRRALKKKLFALKAVRPQKEKVTSRAERKKEMVLRLEGKEGKKDGRAANCTFCLKKKKGLCFCEKGRGTQPQGKGLRTEKEGEILSYWGKKGKKKAS